jgi:hypothetical protein
MLAGSNLQMRASNLLACQFFGGDLENLSNNQQCRRSALRTFGH